MAVAFDAASATRDFSSTTSPSSWTHTASGSDRYARVYVAWAALADSNCSVTYGGVSMTGLTRSVSTGQYGSSVIGKAQIFELINPPTSAETIQVTFDTGNNFGSCCSVSYTGVHQTTASGAVSNSNGSSASSTDTLTITDAVSGDMVGDCLALDAGSGTVTAGQTSRMNSSGGTYPGAAQDAAGSGSVAMTWSWGNGSFAHTAAAIKQASAAAPAVSSRFEKPGMRPGNVPGRFGRNVRTRRDDTTRVAAASGVSGTGEVGTLVPGTSIALTGVAATGEVGTVAASSGSSVALTGVSATGQVGTLTPGAAPALTSVTATGEVGTLSSASSVLQVGSRVRSGALNPGDKLFKLGRFARPRRNTVTVPTVTQAITGVSATGSVGTVGVARASTLSGVEGSGVLGALDPNAPLLEGSRRRNRGFPVGKGPYDFGRFATPRRNVNPAQTAVQSLTGVAATAFVGTIVHTRTVALTGVAATGFAGSVSASQAGGATLTGVGAVTSVGTVSPEISIALTGVSATGQVGTVSAVSGTVVELTGVQALGEVGSLAVQAARGLTGVSATGFAGTMIGTTPGTWVPVNTEARVEGWTPVAD